jgi:hypothetical protein
MAQARRVQGRGRLPEFSGSPHGLPGPPCPAEPAEASAVSCSTLTLVYSRDSHVVPELWHQPVEAREGSDQRALKALAPEQPCPWAPDPSHS